MLEPLKDKSLLIVFAYAPAGLGHLRVTDALYHGLPKEIATPMLLGSQDLTITHLHRLMSLNPIVSWLADRAERNNFFENLSTIIYRYILRSRTKTLYEQMLTIIDEIYTTPTKVLVVATHFGLAHQLAAIKTRLEKEKNIRMILAVQVTDDSPFRIWVVPGADLIAVPSEKTKEKLLRFSKEIGSQAPIVVNAYPLSPNLNKPLSDLRLKEKYSQLDYKNDQKIETIIPISGAAVQTNFFLKLTSELHKRSPRFDFHVVVKNAPFTKIFIDQLSNFDFVHLYIGAADRKVIENYEYIYNKNTISLEITKPSEQSFKALMDCTSESASILLFSRPVGRQEADNIDFLRRHGLIPSLTQEKVLWKMTNEKELLSKASNWRGLCLPYHSIHAADFIYWCLKTGIFKEMLNCRIKPRNEDEYKHELNPNGVKTFWQAVAKLL
jgi:hypothetical protein